MKEIRAFVKTEKLSSVCAALHGIEGPTGMTTTDGRWFGRTRDHNHMRAEEAFDYREYATVDIFCIDDIVEWVVSAIVSSAHTGLRGDGKVYVLPVEDAARIGTGERGESAV